MLLIEIAFIIAALAALLFGCAAVFQAIGLKLPERERELTLEEKEALRAQTRANEAYAESIQSITNYSVIGRGGDLR